MTTTRPKIEYRQQDGFKVGRTTATMTVDKGGEAEKTYTKKYDYPVVSLGDLPDELAAFVTQYFDGDRASASDALEFGIRNRLAGKAMAKHRSALTAPKTIGGLQDALKRRGFELFTLGKTQEMQTLATALSTATTKEQLEALWTEYVRVNPS